MFATISKSENFGHVVFVFNGNYNLLWTTAKATYAQALAYCFNAGIDVQD